VRRVTVLVDDAEVLASDGVVALRGDVWRPAASGRYPTVLVRTPYGREQARQLNDPLVWARQGWAVVHPDVRGRMASTGGFEPFVNETADAVTTLDWICAQEWSDGRIVMLGPSYVGLTQWLAADSGHAGLRGLAPTTTMHDPARWFTEGGTPRRGFLAWWAAGFAATSPDPVTAAHGLALAESLLTDVPGSGWDESMAAVFPAYAGWLSGEPELPKVAADRQLRPAIHVAGWHDLFCEDSLQSYRSMAALAQGNPSLNQRLIVGPWTHIGVGAQLAGDVDYGLTANALVRGLAAETAAFLHAAVEGGDLASGASVFVMGANEWCEFETWPPVSTPLVFHLGESGRLGRTPSDAPVSIVWNHDPTDPVPSRGGRTLGPDLFDSGPRDVRALADRPDVLAFVGEPLAEPLTIVGPVAADITVTCPDLHDLVLRLVDVHPDGRHMAVVEHSHRLAQGGSHTLLVGSTAQQFKVGHRIGLQIAASSWPRLGCASATELTLRLGGGFAGRLVLPALTVLDEVL
jgi:putative CocE/NonD family hydrolase